MTTLCAIGVWGVSALVLTGWITGIEPWWSTTTGPFVMLPNAIVGQSVAALALWCRREGAGARARRASIPLALFVVALGAAVMVEKFGGRDLGIDLLLFPNAVRDVFARHQLPTPGRMALNSCACFVLAGTAILALDVRTRRGNPAVWAATTGLVIVVIALVGYLYRARPLYTLEQFSGMALTTALGFLALFVGLLLSRTRFETVALVSGHDIGSALARRALPLVSIVPLVMGWAWLWARREQYVGREGGIALFVVATMAAMTAIALLGARGVRAADAERQRALHAAQQASRAKSEFLAVMSHELRTPLNAILGYASLLRDGITGPVVDAQRAQLDRIGASATHLVGLIDDILSLSRIEAGRATVLVERVAVARALDDAAAMAAPQAAAKGLAFHVRPPAHDVAIDTDPAKLRQILVNLLSNAVKFTEFGEVVLAAEVQERVVRFTVRDTGLGIDAEHLEHIFEAFWQVERRAAHRPAGTGLGLDVSRRLAQLLGGTLSVASTPGEGSTFTLELPRS